MNRKGQTIFLSVAVGIFFFLFGILFLTFISDEVDAGLAATGLNCDSSTISDGTKTTCLVFEAIVPYFIIAVGGLAVGSITARFRK